MAKNVLISGWLGCDALTATINLKEGLIMKQAHAGMTSYKRLMGKENPIETEGHDWGFEH